MKTRKLILSFEVTFSADADEQDIIGEVENALSQLKEQGVDTQLDKVEPLE